MNPNILKQQSCPSASIPTQPLIRTIGQGSLPPAPAGAPIINPGADCPTLPVGWKGDCWHDGAD